MPEKEPTNYPMRKQYFEFEILSALAIFRTRSIKCNFL